jgi:hypothetical protein
MIHFLYLAPPYLAFSKRAKTTLEDVILNEEQIHELATSESRLKMEVIMIEC